MTIISSSSRLVVLLLLLLLLASISIITTESTFMLNLSSMLHEPAVFRKAIEFSAKFWLNTASVHGILF